ncbi:uncharacterized protein LOC115448965 isoform X2 [Manduca sexta]|uniref:uncharacterized protein LOC115448965 isoform X2 n=1 Tax=Manduca sexta TaxID=7130 RepID=UPI00188DD635|nr:uncharacterized protein LOC115448965 isoform X2 [Manduca sexta]
MRYGLIKQLLVNKNRDDRILVENIFKETTRNGKQILRWVYLALTPTNFIIGSEKVLKHFTSESYISYRDDLRKILSFYPLKAIDLTIFKKSRRQSLKVCFQGIRTTYYELESNSKRNTFWKMWNIYISELNNETKIWPFNGSHNKYRLRWIDKYLYLGDKREIEDQNRPIPVAGLGSKFIKLLNLKPQYFGCRTQSDHWVQCD